MTALSLDFPETAQIAALLDEVTGRAERPIVPPPFPNVPGGEDSPPAPIDNEVPSIRVSVRQLLAEANWRNEAAAATETTQTPKFEAAQPGPLPAPFGVLSVGTMFALINWRNQPDDARPLPLIQPPPPPGAELTVGAVMATFRWE